MKIFWPIALLIVFSTFAVYSITAYSKMAERIGSHGTSINDLKQKVDDLSRRFQEQDSRIKQQVDTAVGHVLQERSAQTSSAAQEMVQPVATRVAELEKRLEEVAARSGTPIAKAEAPAAGGPDAKVEDAVRKVLSERDKARNERMRESLQTQGVELISKRIVSLTETQKQTLAPIMGEHAFKLAEMWWLGTAVDEQGKPLSGEERIKRSDQLRVDLADKVKAQLTPPQQAELDAWILERRAKKVDEREGDGAWRWLFY